MHQSWDDYFCRGFGVDPDLARERMQMLRFEQERAMFNPYDASKATQFYAHPLDFKCQCKRCVRMHTITMQDRVWLSGIKVLWTTAPAPPPRLLLKP
jgi:hypothetical protein